MSTEPGEGIAAEAQPPAENVLSRGPHRACRLVLDAQADTPESLAGYLYHLARKIEDGTAGRGVSGGYSSGAIYELVIGDRPTHEEYFARLDEYLESRRDMEVQHHPV